MQGNSYRRYAAALAFNYQREHPNLRFNFISPIDIQDFLDRKADLIAISGEINLPNCVFLSRGRMIFIPVASPNYLKESGPLDHPKDLTNHYVFSNGFIDRFTSHLSYPFKKKDRLWTMTVTDRIRCSNVEFFKKPLLFRGLEFVLLFLCFVASMSWKQGHWCLFLMAGIVPLYLIMLYAEEKIGS